MYSRIIIRGVQFWIIATHKSLYTSITQTSQVARSSELVHVFAYLAMDGGEFFRLGAVPEELMSEMDGRGNILVGVRMASKLVY